MSTVATLVVSLVLLSFQQPGMPASPDPPSSQETGTIRGRVVDAPSGAPIPRAIVVLHLGASRSDVQRVTSADGIFEFRDVPAGPYWMSAIAGQNVATHVPHRTDYRRPLTLKPGEVREMPLSLLRSRAISGRVLDEAGLPLSRIGVTVRDAQTGDSLSGLPWRQTDDLGAFRIFGLRPGSYTVCAELHSNPSLHPTGRPSRPQLVLTCHPSDDRSGARPVTVATDDVDGIDIRVRRMPISAIRGTIVDSSGAPAAVSVLGLTRLDDNGASSGMSTQHHGGVFTISNVVPGRYLVTAAIGLDASSDQAPPAEAGQVSVEVTAADVEGIVVKTKKPVTITGVVTFEDGAPPALDAFLVRAVASGAVLGWRGSPSGDVEPKADMSFEIKGLFDPQVLLVSGLPADYVLKSVLYRGQDVAYVPTEFTEEPGGSVEVVLTRRAAELSGRVSNERGEPVGSARVLIFPAEKARWSGWPGEDATSSSAGTFRTRRLAAGEYLVVALSEQDARALQSVRRSTVRYQRLAAIAESVVVLENDRRVIDLRVARLPQPEKR